MAWAGVSTSSGPRPSSGRMSAAPNEPMRVRRRLADVGAPAERAGPRSWASTRTYVPDEHSISAR